MRLKSFSTFILGILLSSTVLAQDCNQYTGPGSETFATAVTLSIGVGTTCTQATVPDGADVAIDWINTGSTQLTYLNVFGADGSFQYFDGSGGANTSWLFEDVPAGQYSISWLFSGNVGSAFTHVVGVYPVTAPIPEPSTYALMLVGLGAIAFLAHRRRVKATWVPVPTSTTPG